MSGEKVNSMMALGAQILRTPTEAAWKAPDSHITLSAKLTKDDPHALDDDFTPDGKKAWTPKRFRHKVKKLSKTINQNNNEKINKKLNKKIHK